MKYSCIVHGHFEFECEVEASSKEEAEEKAETMVELDVNRMKLKGVTSYVKEISADG